jgi:Mn2+/Fe2+ NRAMP family transporter
MPKGSECQMHQEPGNTTWYKIYTDTNSGSSYDYLAIIINISLILFTYYLQILSDWLLLVTDIITYFKLSR